MTDLQKLYVLPPVNHHTEVVLAFPATGKKRAAELCPEFVVDLPAEPFMSGDAFPASDEKNSATALASNPLLAPIDAPLVAGWQEVYAARVAELCAEDRLLYVLCPVDEGIAQALGRRGIAYSVAYPVASLKREYLGRLRERRADKAFLSHFGSQWNRSIATCDRLAKGRRTYRLKAGQQLSRHLSFPLMLASLDFTTITCDSQGNPPAIDAVRAAFGLSPNDLLLFDWEIGGSYIGCIEVARGAAGKDPATLDPETFEDFDDAFEALDLPLQEAFEQAALEVCEALKPQIEEGLSHKQKQERQERLDAIRLPVGPFSQAIINIGCDFGDYPAADLLAKHFGDSTGCGIEVEVLPPTHEAHVLTVYAADELHQWTDIPQDLRAQTEPFICQKAWDAVPKLELLRFHEAVDDCNLEEYRN